jgi:signal peptidase II
MRQGFEASKKQIIIGFISVILLIVIDQVTKYIVTITLMGKKSLVLIPGVFELTYLENRGAAFGLLQNKQWLFIILTSVMLIVIIIAYLKTPNIKRFSILRVLLVVLAAGAIGNYIDRIFYGYVVDFFYFSLIDFPVFNVADCYVVVSMIVLFILAIFVWKDPDYDMLFPKDTKSSKKEDSHV